MKEILCKATRFAQGFSYNNILCVAHQACGGKEVKNCAISLARMLCTREVGCIKSNQIDPPCLDLSAGLNPYRAGSERIRENVSQAEKSITVASGCLNAKAERPRPSSSFQLPNRTPLFPMLGPSNFQKIFPPWFGQSTHLSVTYTAVGRQ